MRRLFPIALAIVCFKPLPAEDILIKNANIMTVSNGTIENGSILVSDGTITALGTNISAPPGVEVVDVSGKWITPGIIDCHAHIALDSVNEGTLSVTSMTGTEDVIDPTSFNIYRDLAGGVTTANLLHGSANSIGGKNVVIKLRWGKTAKEMIFRGAMPGIKFALGENPKRSGIRTRGSTDRTTAISRHPHGCRGRDSDRFRPGQGISERVDAIPRRKGSKNGSPASPSQRPPVGGARPVRSPPGSAGEAARV